MDGALSRIAGHEAQFGSLDAPVHAGALCADFERLIRGQGIFYAVPQGAIDVRHGVDEMHCNFLSKNQVHKARRRPGCAAKSEGRKTAGRGSRSSVRESACTRWLRREGDRNLDAHRRARRIGRGNALVQRVGKFVVAMQHFVGGMPLSGVWANVWSQCNSEIWRGSCRRSIRRGPSRQSIRPLRLRVHRVWRQRLRQALCRWGRQRCQFGRPASLQDARALQCRAKAAGCSGGGGGVSSPAFRSP